MKNLEEIIKFIIINLLKQHEFEYIRSNALDILVEIFNGYLDYILTTIKGKVNHSKRNYVNLIDLVKNNKELFISFDIDELDISNNLEFSFQEIIEEETWSCQLNNKPENIIHIYKWMPELPPIHTYRRTFQLERGNIKESIGVKNKIDQSLKSEKNMFKLFNTSGSLPKFINYLYKK
ncbi:hypothetical protein HERIO_1539 [Hepatospora eriocheir]|uniref:Transcription factor TFIID subunit 8 C-terminal domain-containing protein n=1 Tax=Hepatospora eriocheir TaxID=1081669 RepID=A0A1X0QA08_9MICR|nr:hypothetical protein HERIO_1539 [Hepatospora eriocheir]